MATNTSFDFMSTTSKGRSFRREKSNEDSQNGEIEDSFGPVLLPFGDKY
jgi:hypothetical protein